ncbi:hypothetical protein ASPTUDRAFT_356296 [Aspergillus tubingensis CBS 134.48]|uniref:Uncharacterized protein n=1 Tax=Aspergillus tubingensis (strain CBS 134.48) TaxID=767770 RepID=A0A1L9NHW7_ASPTC|nr:hypothetical protein ASPTUDRAFT_356296 [Aspergillus tubingensis CBS 134.48]
MRDATSNNTPRNTVYSTIWRVHPKFKNFRTSFFLFSFFLILLLFYIISLYVSYILFFYSYPTLCASIKMVLGRGRRIEVPKKKTGKKRMSPARLDRTTLRSGVAVGNLLENVFAIRLDAGELTTRYQLRHRPICW